MYITVFNTKPQISSSSFFSFVIQKKDMVCVGVLLFIPSFSSLIISSFLLSSFFFLLSSFFFFFLHSSFFFLLSSSSSSFIHSFLRTLCFFLRIDEFVKLKRKNYMDMVYRNKPETARQIFQEKILCTQVTTERLLR